MPEDTSLDPPAPVDPPAPEPTPEPVPEPDPWDEIAPLPDDAESFERSDVEALAYRAADLRNRGHELHSAVEEIGGLEVAREGARLKKALDTEEGVVDLFIEAGKTLGATVADMEAFFKPKEPVAPVPDPAAPPAPAVDTDPDELISRGDAQALADAAVERAIQERVIAPQQQSEEARRLQEAQNTVSTTLEELKVTDQQDADVILALGQSFIEDGDWRPEAIRAAVVKGNELFQARVEQQAQARLQQKLKDKELVPSSIGSGPAPGGDEIEEPANVEEAKARVRAQIRNQAAG